MIHRSILSLLLLLCFAVQAQQVSYPVFRAYRETTKTAAAEVITIQLPPNASKRAELVELAVYCDQDIDVTVEVNGTSSTSTYFIPSALNIGGVNPVAAPFHTSNSTGGTVVDKYSMFGTTTLVVNLSNIVLPSGMTTVRNVTFRTSSFTGRLTMRVDWAER